MKLKELQCLILRLSKKLYCWDSRHAYQWNRTESPERLCHGCELLFPIKCGPRLCILPQPAEPWKWQRRVMWLVKRTQSRWGGGVEVGSGGMKLTQRPPRAGVRQFSLEVPTTQLQLTSLGSFRLHMQLSARKIVQQFMHSNTRITSTFHALTTVNPPLPHPV